jgi:hypothetical protein
MNTEFKNKWNVWYHHEKDNWTISGYRMIYSIKTIEDFWKIYNNWNKLGGINSKHLFLMKDGITPIWEDKENINGGCWSYKINDSKSGEIWENLSVYLVTENLCKKENEIQGISICLKKKNNSVIKIWNKNSKNNSLSLINDKILEKWGLNIIYIAHMPDKK